MGGVVWCGVFLAHITVHGYVMVRNRRQITLRIWREHFKGRANQNQPNQINSHQRSSVSIF